MFSSPYFVVDIIYGAHGWCNMQFFTLHISTLTKRLCEFSTFRCLTRASHAFIILSFNLIHSKKCVYSFKFHSTFTFRGTVYASFTFSSQRQLSVLPMSWLWVNFSALEKNWMDLQLMQWIRLAHRVMMFKTRK